MDGGGRLDQPLMRSGPQRGPEAEGAGSPLRAQLRERAGRRRSRLGFDFRRWRGRSFAWMAAYRAWLERLARRPPPRGFGLAGALMANDLRFVSPDMMHWTKSGEFMIMVIFGGVGTLAGPWIGAAAYMLLETWLTSITENWQIVLGPVLVVVVLFTHGGLVGLRRFIGRKRP